MFVINETPSGRHVLFDRKDNDICTVAAVIYPDVKHNVPTSAKMILMLLMRGIGFEKMTLTSEDIRSLSRVLMPYSPKVTFSNDDATYVIEWMKGYILITQITTWAEKMITIPPQLTDQFIIMISDAVFAVHSVV